MLHSYENFTFRKNAAKVTFFKVVKTPKTQNVKGASCFNFPSIEKPERLFKRVLEKSLLNNLLKCFILQPC